MTETTVFRQTNIRVSIKHPGFPYAVIVDAKSFTLAGLPICTPLEVACDLDYVEGRVQCLETEIRAIDKWRCLHAMVMVRLPTLQECFYLPRAWLY